MLPINLDPNLARKLDLGMRSSEAIDLPFPVVYIWALNGQASYKSQGSALYFGGWACKLEDYQSTVDQQGLAAPNDWKQATIASRAGSEFEAFTTRTITVAPIGKRESWLSDGKRSAAYVEGARRHLQVLAYLAEIKSENGARQYVPWGPVVLTAKGYQALNLLEAFNRWHKATAQLRWKAAPGVPAWCFYLTLGTFGKERQVINVGKPGAQSPITPITVFIPERLNEERLAGLYVGDTVVAIMADLQDQAAEWLKAWKDTALVAAGEEVENLFPVETGEEIPF